MRATLVANDAVILGLATGPSTGAQHAGQKYALSKPYALRSGIGLSSGISLPSNEHHSGSCRRRRLVSRSRLVSRGIEKTGVASALTLKKSKRGGTPATAQSGPPRIQRVPSSCDSMSFFLPSGLHNVYYRALPGSASVWKRLRACRARLPVAQRSATSRFDSRCSAMLASYAPARCGVTVLEERALS